MSHSISLIEVPRGHYTRALKEAVRRYPTGYAERFLWAGKTWLMCTSTVMPLYPKYFQSFAELEQGIAVCSHEGGLFVYAWHKSDILVCFWGSAEQVSIVLDVISRRPEFKPCLWLDAAAEQELADVFETFPVAKSLEWPNLTDREHQALKMHHVKRLSSKPWLGLFTALSTLVFLGYCFVTWAPWANEVELSDPAADFATRLASTRANLIPLLRLDYNQQLKLLQVDGWRLQSVEYSPQSLSYRLERDAGSVIALRQFATENNLSMNTSGRQANLSQPIQLPSSVPSPTDMRWHSVTELTDWMDQYLNLWLPTTVLKLGTIENVAHWQKQTITIELDDYYLPDLLTLAGILDGLPLQLIKGVLRVQNDVIHGQITMEAIGALG